MCVEYTLLKEASVQSNKIWDTNGTNVVIYENLDWCCPSCRLGDADAVIAKKIPAVKSIVDRVICER